MASSYSDPTVMTGLFKEVYGDSQINLVPDNAKLSKMIPYVQKDKELGNYYHQNVIVTNEAGVSYAAADAGCFSLGDHLTMRTQDAKVQGSQMLLRSSLAYDVAARASNSKKAFINATQMLVKNMTETMAHRQECSLLYGQSDKGLGSGTSGTDSSGVYITFDAGQWAPGIWAGSEKSRVVVQVSTNYFGPYEVTVVDYANKRIKVNATSTTKGADGSRTAANSDIASATIVGVYWDSSVSSVGTGSTGAGVHREMIGIEKMITTSGTLFNISNTDYSLWAGNTKTVTGQLTMGKILSGINLAVAKGLDEDVQVFVNPGTWSDLATDLAALRMFDQSYSPAKGEIGVESLKYHYQGGMVEIISHSCVKEGDAFAFPIKRLKRIGSTDLTFRTPGRSELEIFLPLADSAGSELRCYLDVALFPEAVAKMVKITGFTNS